MSDRWYGELCGEYAEARLASAHDLYVRIGLGCLCCVVGGGFEVPEARVRGHDFTLCISCK